jgi:hypothetical protein
MKMHAINTLALLAMAIGCPRAKPADGAAATRSSASASVGASSSGVSIIDTPPWPEGDAGGVLTLTWRVYPARPDPSHPDDPSLERRVVELAARLGSVTRHVRLPAQTGGLFAENQSVCQSAGSTTAPYARERDEVAKITFYLGGAGGFFVRRSPRDTLTIGEWNQSDGACVDALGAVDACPRKEKAIAKMPVPSAALIAEALIEVQEAAKETAFDCGVP